MALLSKRKRIVAPGIDLMETATIGGISQALYFRGEDIKTLSFYLSTAARVSRRFLFCTIFNIRGKLILQLSIGISVIQAKHFS